MSSGVLPDQVQHNAASHRTHYNGPCLASAKAVADAGHGGMCLFAESTRAVLCAGAPAEARAADAPAVKAQLEAAAAVWLGLLQIKDDQAAEHVYQVRARRGGAAAIDRPSVVRP